ncbi:restriction endonuclease subunit S [Clostridium sp. BNL1100]|uniref:restriction endonuclease subunit S n=1 Tax=Clostridium sp. BNL1100 TaxID=755731 RepID=UPI00024A7D28|nr:restriction endonuclease subunit S [Clostridium sp. BNL1100]AEY67521.1 restriction endonuclease S subunit [Clostridium sp. BNL1100]
MSKHQLTRFEVHKDSEIEWLGEIPSHWDIKRVKDLAFLQSGNSIVSEQIEPVEGLYPVYGGNGLRGYYSSYTNEGEHILIGRQGALCGNINYAKGKFWASEHAVVVYLKKNVIIKWFGEMLRVMNLNQYSLSAAQPGLAVDRIKRLLLPFPSPKEQKIIADYIDTKTIQIDCEIELHNQKLTKYNELKQSLINETVNRGLDKAVVMKDSGVEWIGEVPEHWHIKRIKDLFVESKIKSLTGEETLLSVSEYTGVTQRKDNIGEDELLTNAETLIGYKICRMNDLVMNIMLAWKRGLGVSAYDGIVSPSYSPSKLSCPAYFHYLLRSDRAIAEFKRNSTGIIESRLRLYSDNFYAINVAIPEYIEQKAIADYLDTKTAHIDRIIEVINTQISKLKELRKTLINDVVIGKIKVTVEGEAV